MKKKILVKQLVLAGCGGLLVLAACLWGISHMTREVRSAGGAAYEARSEKAIHRVATGNRVSCLNVWGANGSGAAVPMTIYYNQEDAGIEAPQIIYLRDENVNTVFCIQYGSQLSSGNGISTCTAESYERLNEAQKTGISQVLGCAAMKYAPRDGEGGYNVRDTGACTFANFQLYNSTQLMIWYCIDAYSGRPGSGGTGGITWDGVVRTCLAGWGNLGECERILNELEHMYDRPDFCGDAPEKAPVLELKYNSATDAYEGVVTDNSGRLDTFQGVAVEGIEWIRCNEDGSENEQGNSLLIRSRRPIEAESTPVVLTWRRSIAGGSITYLANQDEPQDLAFYNGNTEQELCGYLRIVTEEQPDIEVIKQDADTGKPLPGVTLELYEGDRLLARWKTEETAYTVDGLHMGHTYRLHEVCPLEGYVQAEDMAITIFETKQRIIMENRKITGSLYLRKINEENGDSLPGVIFELFRNTDTEDEKIGAYTTDRNGELHVEDLEYGEYYLIEKKAAAGFLLSDARYVFSIAEDGVEVRLEAENRPEVTTTENQTTAGTTEQITTEAAREEWPTAVAGASLQKETEAPRTGDSVSLAFAGIGILLSGALCSVINRKK